MFTFGIFTTHFPYIVIVVFYAWFFIFGVKTPVNDETKISESKFNIELQTAKVFADTNHISNFHYHDAFGLKVCFGFEESLFKRKLHHQGTLTASHWQYCFGNSLFSRPPPSLI